MQQMGKMLEERNSLLQELRDNKERQEREKQTEEEELAKMQLQIGDKQEMIVSQKMLQDQRVEQIKKN